MKPSLQHRAKRRHEQTFYVRAKTLTESKCVYVNGVCTCLCVWLVSFPKFKCLIVIGNVLKMPKQSHFSANQLQKGIGGIKVQYLPPKCILSLFSEKHIIQLLPIFTFYHVQNIYIVALQVSVTSI